MISTKGRYAIRVMIDLAQNDQGNYIPLKDIAARQQISRTFFPMWERVPRSARSFAVSGASCSICASPHRPSGASNSASS